MSPITLLNYADSNFRQAQRKNSRTGRRVGKFDSILQYGPKDIDAVFRKTHAHILSSERGGGYWLWKPYFVYQTLHKLSHGDWLFYCDAGAYFTKPIAPLVKALAPYEQDVFPFGLPDHVERAWTRPEVLEAIAPGRADIANTPQRLGCFHLWRCSEQSKSLAATWLNACCRTEWLTDRPVPPAEAENTGFREHRHDQSIFSILTKLRGLESFRDPSQYGIDHIATVENSPYPPCIHLSRQRDLSMAERARRLYHRLNP